MSKSFALVLSTVNAPHSKQLDGVTLSLCLNNIELAKAHPGHVSSFLGEVPVEDQIAFAGEFGLTVGALKAFASQFAAWSGESYKLAA